MSREPRNQKGMGVKECLETLGLALEEDQTVGDVKKAYRRIVMETRPDIILDDPEKKQKFQKATEAYKNLMGDFRVKDDDLVIWKGIKKGGSDGEEGGESMSGSGPSAEYDINKDIDLQAFFKMMKLIQEILVEIENQRGQEEEQEEEQQLEEERDEEVEKEQEKPHVASIDGLFSQLIRMVERELFGEKEQWQSANYDKSKNVEEVGGPDDKSVGDERERERSITEEGAEAALQAMRERVIDRAKGILGEERGEEVGERIADGIEGVRESTKGLTTASVVMGFEASRLVAKALQESEVGDEAKRPGTFFTKRNPERGGGPSI